MGGVVPQMYISQPVSKNDELCIQNEEFCIKNEECCTQNEESCIENEELCIKNEELCIKNEELCRLGTSNTRTTSAMRVIAPVWLDDGGSTLTNLSASVNGLPLV